MLRSFRYEIVALDEAGAPRVPATVRPLALREEHLRNGRLVADRMALLDRVPKGGVVAELGVGFGDFSAMILARLEPREFHAIDFFGWHDVPTVWGVPTRERFGGRSHEE